MKKNDLLNKMLLKWMLGLLCLGCTSQVQKEFSRYDESSGESYYEWLYRDSAYIDGPGDPMRPWIEPMPDSVYIPAYRRMVRHLRLRDTLAWDFSAKDVKVSQKIYDYVIDSWLYDNRLIRSRKFAVELSNTNFKIRPTGRE